MRRAAVRNALLLLGCALVLEVGIRGAGVDMLLLRESSRRSLARGEVDRAAVGFARVARESDAPADHLALAVARLRGGRLEAAAAALSRIEMSGVNEGARDSALVRDVAHARSALYLLRAGIEGATPTPVGPPSLDTTDPRELLAAARDAARTGLRADPASAGLRWNLWLARPDADEARQPARELESLAGSASFLQRGLRSAETRSVREGLPAVLRALEARLPKNSDRGPPW